MNQSGLLTLLTIVSGGSYTQREVAIAAAIAQSPAKLSATRNAVILEGLPDGDQILSADSSLQVQRIASGCMCCIGNLVLRVTLNRALKNLPTRLYLGFANTEHLDPLMNFLRQPPYCELLKLEQEFRI